MQFVALLILAASPQGETEWAAIIASRIPESVVEYRCPDGSRVDILTPTEAIEVERSGKWKEAPAQAVLYGLMTNRKPVVILLIPPGDDPRYYLRCLAVCNAIGVELRTFRIH